MNCLFFPNDNDICKNNNKESRNIIKIKLQRNKDVNKKENKESVKYKLLNQNFFKELSIKRTRIKKIDYDNNSQHNEINHKSNNEKYDFGGRTIFPLLNNEIYKKIMSNSNPNSNSLINVYTKNKEKDSNLNYLYLEYKKDKNDKKSVDDITYIKINPHKIIAALIDFPNIKQIFQILTKKINSRNIINKDADISNSRINIEELFNDLYANRNRKKNKFDLKYNSLNSISGKNKLSSTTTTLIIPEEEKNKEKKNYPVLDLFLFDIINKVINKSIFLHDRRNQTIDEEFMMKEYKNQIAKLKLFFYEKINDKKIANNFINLYEITRFGGDVNKSKKNEKNWIGDVSIILKKRKIKQLNEIKKENSENKILKKPNSNIYSFDIGPKINIIDSNELLNNVKKQNVVIKRNINFNDTFLNKLIELNKKKIKFENLMIEEKTKILNDKINNNIFKNKNSKYFSRNIINRNLNRKKLFIRSKLFNEYENESETDNKIQSIEKAFENNNNSYRKITVYETNNPYSSYNDNNDNNDYIKLLSKNEPKKKRANDGGKKIIEKLSTKSDFFLTKVGFNKTINKINKMNYNNQNNIKKRMKVYNFSFLNTIYGRINTKRKMKINELDFKKDMKKKGFQLLFNAMRNPYLKMNKSISAENVLSFNKSKKNIISLDKIPNTKEIIFNY